MSKSDSEQDEEAMAIDVLCANLVVSNKSMKGLFRRAKRALEYAIEAIASEKDDSAPVAKAMYGLN